MKIWPFFRVNRLKSAKSVNEGSICESACQNEPERQSPKNPKEPELERARTRKSQNSKEPARTRASQNQSQLVLINLPDKLARPE